MNRLTTTFTSLLIALMLVLPAQAATQAPDALVKDISDQVLAELKLRQNDLKAGGDKAINAFVDKYVLPHFDFEYMSQLIVAKYWRQATPEQRSKFTEAFKGLLVRTYANSLLEYSDEAVEFLPYRGKPGDDDVTVKVEIIPAAGPSIPMDYQLHLTNGSWKVYDVNVDGLSLVGNYRRTFGKKIKQDGMDALIADMEDRN